MKASQRDGGYGWIIVFSFFLSEFIMDGIRFSFGMLYVDWLLYFKRGKGETAWIGSVLIGAYNLGGPFFVVILNKLGCRWATILGALLSTAGYILSFFAPNVYCLYVFFGIMPGLGFYISGLGFGIVMLAGTVSVGRYFFNKRALAIGIAYSGSGIGTMIFNPVSRVFLDTYGWRGTMFIFASFALNLCVLGALHRPFITETGRSDDVDNKADETNIERHQSDLADSQEEARDGLVTSTNAEKEPMLKDLISDVDKHIISNSLIATGKDEDDLILDGSKVCGKGLYDKLGSEGDGINEQKEIENNLTHMNNDFKSFNETVVNKTIDADKHAPVQACKQVLGIQTVNTGDVDCYNSVSKDKHLQSNVYDLNKIHKQLKSKQETGSYNSLSGLKTPEMRLKAGEIQVNGSVNSLSSIKPYLLASQSILGSCASLEILFERKAYHKSIFKHVSSNSQEDKQELSQRNNIFLIFLKNAFPKELVSDVNFVLLMVGNFFFGIAAFIPIALLPDYCLYVGCRMADTGWLISMFGVTGILSRIVGGWITDLPCVNRLVFHISLVLCIGVITLLCPVLRSFELLMLYAVLLGLSMGAIYVVQPMFLIEFFGEQNLPPVFGMLMLSYGVSGIIGAPIAGRLFDVTGDYNISFLFAGANCILSVILHLVVLCSKRSCCA